MRKRKPTKPKKGCKFLRMGHFNYELCISYNLTYPELLRRCKSREESWGVALEEHKDFCLNHHYFAFFQEVTKEDEYRNHFFIFLKGEMALTVEDLGTISHECTHIVQFVFKYIRADMIQEQENAAYFQEYLFKEVTQFIQDTNAK